LTTGRITELQKSVYTVDTAAGAVACVLKGTLKGRHAKPCVGDSVAIEVRPDASPPGVITELLPRRNMLRRPFVANVDRILFMVSMREPRVELQTIDRFLVGVEARDLSAALLFNKTDLLDTPELDEQNRVMALYQAAGYAALALSAQSGEGVEELKALCAGRVSILAGMSGVGKSTLLNRLFPEGDIATAEVSGKTGRGVHTTSTTMLLRLGPGTYIADTPGFAAPDLPDMDSRDVAASFPEMRALTGRCQFNDCRHDGEPGCVVREQVACGAIAQSRFHSYLAFMTQLRSQERKKPQARNQ
jgi:ribosome biogenesis GTPase / thiamine phosphate phosphatase